MPQATSVIGFCIGLTISVSYKRNAFNHFHGGIMKKLIPTILAVAAATILSSATKARAWFDDKKEFVPSTPYLNCMAEYDLPRVSGGMANRVCVYKLPELPGQICVQTYAQNSSGSSISISNQCYPQPIKPERKSDLDTSNPRM